MKTDLVDGNGKKFEEDLSCYFRNDKGYDDIEKTLFDNVEGNKLLDIGCEIIFLYDEILIELKN